jgi:hypothetical protein
MAITLTPGTAAQSTTSVTTLSVPLPASLASGDWLLLVGTSNASGGGFSATPAGWTEVLPNTDSVNGYTSLHGAVWSRKWVSGDTDPSMTFASGRAAGICIRVVGADPATLIDVAAQVTQGVGATQATVSCPSLDPVISGAALVFVAYARSASGGSANYLTFSVPAGMTDVGYAHGADTTTTNSNEQVFLEDGATGATGVRTSTLSGAATGSFGVSFLLRPPVPVPEMARNSSAMSAMKGH